MSALPQPPPPPQPPSFALPLASFASLVFALSFASGLASLEPQSPAWDRAASEPKLPTGVAATVVEPPATREPAAKRVAAPMSFVIIESSCGCAAAGAACGPGNVSHGQSCPAVGRDHRAGQVVSLWGAATRKGVTTFFKFHAFSHG